MLELSDSLLLPYLRVNQHNVQVLSLTTVPDGGGEERSEDGDWDLMGAVMAAL